MSYEGSAKQPSINPPKNGSKNFMFGLLMPSGLPVLYWLVPGGLFLTNWVLATIYCK
jgi:hypothetical protein